MIVNYEYKNGNLITSYIDTKGNLKIRTDKWNSPLQWEICSDNDIQKSDKYKTWNKKSVKKVSTRYPNRYTIYEKLRELDNVVFEFNEPKMFFCDIEVEVTEGFPEAHLAENSITSIALIHDNKVMLLGIKPIDDKLIDKMEKDMNLYLKDFKNDYKIKWVHCKTEYELLDIFFNQLMPKIPVLTGWNFINYDWVYLVTRARKIGINPEVASPTGQLIKPWKKNEDEFKPTYEELPKHRFVFDYMDIFAKWDTSIKIRESLSLDFISANVLGVKKLEYEGSIKDLYHNDWYTYLLYNCIDTALVQLIHEKQRTANIMLSISNLAKIPMEDVLSQIRVTEGVLYDAYYKAGIVMCKQNKKFSINDNDGDNDEEFKGGYVKFPSVGLKMWVVVFDYASLYPTTMRQFNIAPESFKGMKINDTESMLDGVIYQIDDTDIVLPNGAVFINEESQTKQVLTNIYFDRKSNKNIGLDYFKKHKLISNYLEQRKVS